MTHTCSYCKHKFANKGNLNLHLRTAKYCMKLRKHMTENTHIFKCRGCKHEFTLNYNRDTHEKKCNILLRKKCKKTVQNLKNKYRHIIAEKDKHIRELESRLENIAIHAVDKPTTVNVSLLPVSDEHIQRHVNDLTLDHILKGAVGYSDYTLDYPLKDRVVCTDFARRKVRYKDSNNDIITDPGMTTLCQKLFSAINERNKQLIDEYIQQLDSMLPPGETLRAMVEQYSNRVVHVRNISDGEKPKLYHDFVREICAKKSV